MNANGRSFDLVSIGECLVELSRESDGRYRVSYAGDALNTLFYASRLGMQTGFVTTFGDDLFTPMIREGIAAEKIDISMTEVLPGRKNGLYFIELDRGGEYTFHFWRKSSAATETLRRCEVDRLTDYCASATWLLISGITLAVMEERERLSDFLARLQNISQTRIAFDTNYRPTLWESSGEYVRAFEEIIPFVDLFLPSESDLQRIWPGLSAEEIANIYHCDQVALKQGAEGCLLMWNGKHYQLAPPEQVQLVDATGAGDAFNGGFLTGLLRGWSPEDAALLGMRVAGSVVGVRGAIDLHFSIET
ncbi:MAG: sugar kinase [Ignavibacteriae bacterium]|nr:sugar kinase [Ignavibacteriota bacterium]